MCNINFALAYSVRTDVVRERGVVRRVVGLGVWMRRPSVRVRVLNVRVLDVGVLQKQYAEGKWIRNEKPGLKGRGKKLDASGSEPHACVVRICHLVSLVGSEFGCSLFPEKHGGEVVRRKRIRMQRCMRSG